MAIKTDILVSSTVQPWDQGQRFFVREIPIDFSDISGGVIDADVIQLCTIPAGEVVLGAAMKVNTTVTGSGTISAATGAIGDDASTAGYVAAQDLLSTGATKTIQTDALSLAAAGGKLYTSSNTIDMLIAITGAGGTITAGAATVYVWSLRVY